MAKKVNQYMLERIPSQMAKRFGTIPKGREADYSFLLFPMEGNLLKLHRQDPSRNGYDLLEAIGFCLLTIDGYLRDIEYDFSGVATDKNSALAKGLLMSFDPETNEELKTIFEEAKYDWKQEKEDYFAEPVKCILRIRQSVSLFTKELGPIGYFNFFANQAGSLVDDKDKLDFAVRLRQDRQVSSVELSSGLL